MRKWATLLVLCVLASPAFAAKLFSIEQMEGLLARLHGKADGKVAAELDEVQLTERVSPARLAQWETQFPGARTHEEMMRLADLSAFQHPPVDDVLRDPEPDADTQVQILTSAARYVRATIARLPDFFASRDTTHFESLVSQHVAYSVESPANTARDEHASLSSINIRAEGVDSATEIEALHSAGLYSTTVTYRDGHEMPIANTGKQTREPNLGLTTSGEFGPILAVVVGDALQSKISWLRWEQRASEPEAVFQFSVPEEKAHFAVDITEWGKTVVLTPAYHGELEVDPATGEILRLSVIADMMPPRQAIRAAIMVEFAPVTIGNRTYVCPLRGVAFSRFPIPNASAGSAVPMQTELNDVAFTSYHEFRSEMRILANNGANGDANPPTANAPAASEPAPAEAAANVPPPAAPAANPGSAPSSPAPPPEASAAPPAKSGSTPAASGPAPAETAAAAPAAPQPTPAPPPATSSPAPADTTTGALPSSTVLHTNTQLVLVDVVVTNHDHPVQGLNRDRFRIFEDGHELPISSFDEFSPAAAVTVDAPPPLPPNTYSNVPTYPDTGAVNVLLLDALNTPAADQEQVRRTMIDYLGSIRPGTPLAIFTLSSRLRMAAGFTTDGAQLLKVLQSQKGKPSSAAGVGSGRGQDASSDLTHAASSMNNSSDPGTRWLVGQIMQFSADMKNYDTDQRERLTLDALRQLAQYLTAVPGRKNVIWFSGSFPIGLGPETNRMSTAEDQRDYSRDVEQTSEQLAAARVSVYPVDARGVITAPTTDASYVPPPSFGNAPGRNTIDSDNKSFSIESAQDRGTMNSIAADTGGHVYSAGNDLKKAVEKIVAADSSYYAISYVPPPRMSGTHGAQFHTIEVKVDGGYQLAYRRGYFEDAPTSGLPSTGNAPAPMLAAATPGAPLATQILFQARVLPESARPSTSPTGTALVAGPAGDIASPASAAGEETDAARGETGAAASDVKPGERRYSVDLGVDPRSLTFAESANGAQHAQLQCALVAFDGEGNQLNSLSRVLGVNLSAQQFERLHAAGKTLPVHLAFDLPPGAATLRIVVYDTASARTGSLEIPVDAAAAAGQ
jgi:VWFA-related protein